jgi:hypothetical protein
MISKFNEMYEEAVQTPNSVKFKGELYLDETNNFRKLYLTRIFTASVYLVNIRNKSQKIPI